jgi:geranylgeranyl pyrophosphate synthase
MEKVDTNTLANVINRCFALATDARVSPASQKQFLAEGKRLRGLLLNLLSAQFDNGTEALKDANGQLAKVDADLADSVAVLQNVAQTVANISSVVGALDKLLGIAAAFI